MGEELAMARSAESCVGEWACLTIRCFLGESAIMERCGRVRSYTVKKTDKSWFEERFITSYKGRGVFALVHVEKGCFVLEYQGELISQKESFERHRKYTETQCFFVFFLTLNGMEAVGDAAKEDGALGRLVNDDRRNANCKMKKIMVNGKPHLYLFAIQNIDPEEEITYNYGDSSWHWRSLVHRNNNHIYF
ncbi:N-lysine methyltransferase KMT5A-A-like isoform X2 [Colossoma macropomum]|uniref:N-lysine methyltransferase KMT5A-A-like isoform X2 n=1 Tax=Colossoma macropomum TaxID=42526 RepID=UPI00186558C7|nr:N-lysine methyltransferase KMT5A-A-like isoform X2 [Colossoma macropomum]